jgi:hypothetical protein
MERTDQLPGEAARQTGEYHELTVLGALTGSSISVREGEPLPSLPRGFTWRYVPVREG